MINCFSTSISFLSSLKHVAECQTEAMMMIHGSLWLCIRSTLGFLESFTQCPRQWRSQHVKRHFPLTITPTQPNEAEQPPCNCHLFWSHMKLPKRRLNWQSITLTLWMLIVQMNLSVVCLSHSEIHLCVVWCVTSAQIHV